MHTVRSADSLIRHGIVGSVRSSVEDLAGWARVERPDLDSVTSDGRVVLVFSDIEGSTARNESMGDRDWVQRALLENPERYDNVRVRIGAHAGSSVRRGDDLFGRDVAMAARIADLADGGQVLVSHELRESMDDCDGITFDAPFEVELKGLRGTQTVYPVAVAG